MFLRRSSPSLLTCPALHATPAPYSQQDRVLPHPAYHSAREKRQTRCQKRAQSPSLSSVPLQSLLLWGGCHRPTACPRPKKKFPKTCRGISGTRCPGIGHGSCCCISPGWGAVQHERQQIKTATLALKTFGVLLLIYANTSVWQLSPSLQADITPSFNGFLWYTSDLLHIQFLHQPNLDLRRWHLLLERIVPTHWCWLISILINEDTV